MTTKVGVTGGITSEPRKRTAPAGRNERIDVQAGTNDVTLRDYDDQLSALLIARSRRLAGHCDDAFDRLAWLRSQVLLSDRKSATLLPQIDREIAAAHAMCRRDRNASKGTLETVRPTLSKAATWLRRTATVLDRTMLRIAISIVLAVHLYKFLQGIA